MLIGLNKPGLQLCSSVFKISRYTPLTPIISSSSKQSFRSFSLTIKSWRQHTGISRICMNMMILDTVKPSIISVFNPFNIIRQYTSQNKKPHPTPSPSPSPSPSIESNFSKKDDTLKSKTQEKEPNEIKKGFMDGPQIQRFFALARDDSRILILGISLVLLATCINMTFPWYLGQIIDVFGEKQDNFFGLSFGQFFALLGGLFIIGSAASGAANTCLKVAGERIIARIRRRSYNNIIRRETEYFDRNSSGDLISRLMMDVSIVGTSLTNNVANGLKASLSGIIGLVMMAYISPTLSLYLLFLAPPMVYASTQYGRYVRKIITQKQEAYGSLVKEAEERLNSIRTIQAFSTESREVSRFSNRVQNVFNIARRESIATGLFTAGTCFAEDGMNIFVLAVGGLLVLKDTLTVGQLTQYLFYSFYVSETLQAIGATYSDIMKGVGAASRVLPILEDKGFLPLEGEKVIKNGSGKLKFDNVTFAYPLRPNAPIFKNLSFEVKPGSSVAIVGRSGQGKSTIASLLLRYYEPQKGSIRINDQDIREYTLRSWRDQIAIVNQEPTLFSGTIGENIKYAIEGPISKEELYEVIYKSSCGFVFDLPHQLDTEVGANGTQMSGGMKQRIAIARALLKKPTIMILDEATSSLDASSEKEVNSVFRRLSQEGKVTVFIIAHKLNAIKSADMIVVLADDGSLAEVGSFNELVGRKDSAFNRLMAMEFHSKGDEEELEVTNSQPTPLKNSIEKM